MKTNTVKEYPPLHNHKKRLEIKGFDDFPWLQLSWFCKDEIKPKKMKNSLSRRSRRELVMKTN